MPKLVWRVKVIAELEPGVATETEVARVAGDVDRFARGVVDQPGAVDRLLALALAVEFQHPLDPRVSMDVHLDRDG